MKSYKSYAQYKPSEVEWLGDIPEHWKITRLKNVARYFVSNLDKKSAEGEQPVRLCNYTDVYYNENITDSIEFMQATATLDEIKKFQLKIDDVVITKDSEEWNDIAIAALNKYSADDFVCGYHLAIIRCDHEHLLGNYLFRAMQTQAINHQFQIAASGVTRYGLPKNAIGEALVGIPPVSEQRAISEFLDRETGKIDDLIGKRERLIALLQEKRAAVISHAVTKGLDPNVKLKPSGIDWLGDIPNHWEIWKIAHGYTQKGSGTTPTSDEEKYYDGNINWVTTSELRESLIYQTNKKITQEAVRDFSALRVLPKGSLLIAMYGATIGRLGILAEEATTNQACCALVKSSIFENNFMFYWFQALKNVIMIFASGGGQPNISQEKICSLMIAIPEKEEQQEIVSFLNQETSKINALIDKENQIIDKLREYRTALISAAVTGKIDVRESVDHDE